MALYNKYRPRSLSEVIGQTFVKKILSSQVEKNDLVHAYVFYGPAGTGKTTVARIFAAMVNCSSGMSVNPNISDPHVSQILAGTSQVDVVEFDAASTRGIDHIRELREKAYHSPLQMKYKVYIIDECHRLTNDSWEALLKILEEPPKHAIFILCTTEVQSLRETIKTRCMMMEFRSLKTEEIAEGVTSVCSKEKLKIEENAANLLAVVSKGSMRDALSKLERLKHSTDLVIDANLIMQVCGVVGRSISASFIKAVVDRKFAEALTSSSKAIGNGVSGEDFLRELASYCHDLIFSSAPYYDLSSLGYTDSEIEESKQLKASILKVLGDNNSAVVSLLSAWTKVIDANLRMTVFNVHPQALADITYVDLWNEMTRRLPKAG